MGEYQGSCCQAVRKCSELEDLPGNHKLELLPGPRCYRDMEVCIHQVHRCRPVSWVDSIRNGSYCLHLEGWAEPELVEAADTDHWPQLPCSLGIKKR